MKNRAGRSGAAFEGIYFNNGTCTISFDHAVYHKNEVEFISNMKKEKMNADQQYAAKHFSGPEDNDYEY